MNVPSRGKYPSQRREKTLNDRSLNANSIFVCCSWPGPSQVRLVIIVGGQVTFPQDSGNGLSEQKGSRVLACVSAALVSWKHISDPPGRQGNEGGRRNLLWLWLMWVQSMQGAKAPVIRETWLPVQGAEAVKLPLDPSLQEGKYIESVISLSQASLPPPFFNAFFFSLFPSRYGIWAISPSSAFDLSWKRFQSETNFCVIRQDFERGASLLSTREERATFPTA